ncbi:DoxX family protein [Sinorhizobium numidicum]|uniref:DoxX family protein n=1 Tax=Sinorhizobium numidicum TaxID=680248 RepID=A0ABY8CN37_9HYPH|nr:DoxX family protein [Sinorhizobium numidicum]WEX74088.1 DoxX family protein [Sinorhizobium numidicum]WEX80073.1 DoxX family protein [Sinorhizobium numidicum]
MTTMHITPASGSRSIYRLHDRLVEWATALPLSIVQLGARVAVAEVFWQSAQTKLGSWPVTLQLFAFEYRLPLIDPALAATMATAAELSGAVMLSIGLLSRLASLMLLGVVATIQVFVYPGHWAEHLMWASLLLLMLSRGAGFVSVDHLIAQRIRAGG